MSNKKMKNEVGGTLTAVNSAQKFVGVLSLLKKATITATAVYVAVMVFKIYKES